MFQANLNLPHGETTTAPPQKRKLKLVEVVSHPTGGFTLAIPINQYGTSRIYHQWFPTREAAEQSCRHHNADLRKRYKNNPNFADDIASYYAQFGTD